MQTYFARVNVVAVAVDVGVVLEEDVKGRPGSLGNGLAVITSDDYVGDLAVLADDPKAQLLQPQLLETEWNAPPRDCSPRQGTNWCSQR